MTETGDRPTSSRLDLSACDREPIHVIGHVQSFGCLLAVSNDWLVTHASANCAEFLDQGAEALIGRPLLDILSGRAVHDIRSRLQMLSGPNSVERLFDVAALDRDDRRLDVAVHMSGQSVVLEFERSEVERRTDIASYVRPMVERLRRAATVDQLCSMASRHLKALSGFDRVMVYRFLEDGSGEVVAEARKPDAEPFLGLRYPATDIPRQARELYLRNPLRIISDVEGTTAPILPPAGADDEAPLDLSLSELRAVSPIHLQYLRNMGVAASMSISIVRGGALWGLFACHHDRPRVLSNQQRTALEMFGHFFSLLLDSLASAAEREQVTIARALHERLMLRLAGGVSIAEDFAAIADELGKVIPFDGIVAWVDNRFKARGEVPAEDDFQGIVRMLNAAPGGGIFHTDHLQQHLPAARRYADRAAGLLALPVSRAQRDYIVLFRREVATTIHWAGDPEKAVGSGSQGGRLTPRNSFETWKQTVSGRSRPWTVDQVQIADAFRITLLEIILRISDAANAELSRNQDHQELLIAELNHRVRNILTLTRGLVSMSRSQAASVEDFAAILDGRIQALSRAHDQVTRENWSSVSFRTLLATELSAYHGEGSDRVVITGPDVLLKPGAATTMALVFHELITNSVKYGALGDPGGTLSIAVAERRDGALSVQWRESGGPRVRPVTRRGFGTTLIERSIPFELQGTADIRFKPSGLEADFLVPLSNIDRFVQERDAAPVEEADPADGAPVKVGQGLIVEDNLIIALDAQDILARAGVRSVVIASSVDDALERLQSTDFDVAFLDIQLGAETSQAVAEQLRQSDTPFVFATGYGHRNLMVERFAGTPVLMKPYRLDSVRTTLRQLLDRSGDAGGPR